MTSAPASWNELGRLVHSDGTGGFGYSVAISGDTIVAGTTNRKCIQNRS